jgi:low affinity Fe/Cu permease
LPGVLGGLVAEVVSVGHHWKLAIAIAIAVLILILTWLVSRSKLFERLARLLGLGDH